MVGRGGIGCGRLEPNGGRSKGKSRREGIACRTGWRMQVGVSSCSLTSRAVPESGTKCVGEQGAHEMARQSDAGEGEAAPDIDLGGRA